MIFYSNLPACINYPFIMKKFSKRAWERAEKNKLYILDCGVYDLKKNGEYDLKKYEFLKEVEPKLNVEIVIPDYPSDLIGDSQENIEKTFQNIALFYEEYSNHILLPVIQSLTQDIASFRQSFKRFRKTLPNVKRVGLGNLCMCKKLDYYKQVFHEIKHFSEYSFHVFGMTIRAVPIFKHLERFTFDSSKWNTRHKKWRAKITFDSMKWTRPHFRSEFSSKTEAQRVMYFISYVKRIKQLSKMPKYTIVDYLNEKLSD